MMISNFYLFMNYFLSLFLFFNYNSPIFFWVLMEYNLISFILLLCFDKSLNFKTDSLNQIIFYFLIQSSASILFLSNFSLGDWFGIFNYDIMFIISLVTKIGLFPIFFWIFMMAETLSVYPLIFLLSFQKIPLLSGLYSSNSLFMILLLFFSFVLGSVLLYFSSNLIMMFICSSLSYSFMLFFLFTLSIPSFLIFFLIYSGFLFFCLSMYLKDCQGNNSSFFPICCYMFFLGLPPLGLFFYKFIFSGLISSLLGPMELFLFWGFSFVSLMGYVKFFFNSFFLTPTLYLVKLTDFKILGVAFFIFTTFSLFLS